MLYLRISLFLVWTWIVLKMTLSSSPIESTGTEGLYELAKAVVTYVAPTVDASWVIAKTFHFVAYAMWAWLLAGLVVGGYLRQWAPWQVWLCVGLLILMAGAQEGLQNLVPTRHPSVRDVCINIAGGALALGTRPLLVGFWSVPTGCPAEETQ